MSAKTDLKKTQQRKRIIFLSSLLVSAFWLSGRIGNVYRFPALGAIYELFWLPALALLVVLPVISFYYWSREKFSVRSLYLYSILLVVISLIFSMR